MKHLFILAIALITSITFVCADAEASEPSATRPVTYYVDVVDSRKKLSNLSMQGGTAPYALFTVTPIRDNPVIPIGGESFCFDDVFSQCTASIPVFDVKTPQMCSALEQYATNHSIDRYVVASSSAQALENAGACYGKWFIADGLDEQSIALANQCNANGILLPESVAVTQDMASYASSNGLMLLSTQCISVTNDANTSPSVTQPAPSPTAPRLPIQLPFGLENAIAPLAGALLTISVAVAVFFRKRRA